MGTGVAWKMRKQPNTDFLAGNRTQTGQKQTDGALALFAPLHGSFNPGFVHGQLTFPFFSQPGLWLSTSSPRVSRTQEQSWLGELSRTDRLGCLWSGSSNFQLWQLFKRSISCAPAHKRGMDADADAQSSLPRQIAE
jgi:hypothetical protein